MYFNKNNRITYGGTSILYVPQLGVFQYSAYAFIDEEYVLQESGEFFGYKDTLILYNGSSHGVKSFGVYNKGQSVIVPFYHTEIEKTTTVNDVINVIIRKIKEAD